MVMASNNGGNRENLECSTQVGVPTLTTPTLTPTTLRNIEQMFIDANVFSDCHQLEQPVIHENAAHFVPPNVTIERSVIDSNLGLPELPGQPTLEIPPLPGPPVTDAPSLTHIQSSHQLQVPLCIVKPDSAATVASLVSRLQQLPHSEEAAKMPNDDEERRRVIRRQRNKEAAARCRKRRLDQTLSLQDDVEKLEADKAGLKNELDALEKERDRLSKLLNEHTTSGCNVQRLATNEEKNNNNNGNSRKRKKSRS